MANFYTIRAARGVAFISIDEATGAFMSYGTFGRFGYCWPPSHRSESLVEFLSGLDFDYFMKKVTGSNHVAVSTDKTLNTIKRAIIERRRHGGISKADARAAFEALYQVVSSDDRNELVNDLHLANDMALGKLFDSTDLCDFVQYVPNPNCLAFWKEIWPAFLEVATKDLVSTQNLKSL